MVNSIIQKTNARLTEAKIFKVSFKLYFFIQCYFDYACSFLYPGLTHFVCKKLQITQREVIRFVLNLDPRSYCGPDEF